MKTKTTRRHTWIAAGTALSLISGLAHAQFNDAFPVPGDAVDRLGVTYTNSASRVALAFESPTTSTPTPFNATGDLAIAGVAAARGGWIFWVPDVDGRVKLSLRSNATTPTGGWADFDSRLAVYQQSAEQQVLGATNIRTAAQNLNISSTNNRSEVIVKVKANGFYWIHVDSDLQAGLGALSLEPAPEGPTNDDFDSAQDAAFNTLIPGDNSTATSETDEPRHNGRISVIDGVSAPAVVGLVNAGTAGASVWYKWTPTADQAGLVEIKTSDSVIDPMVVVYQQNSARADRGVAGLWPIAASNDESATSDESFCRINALAGQTYYIAVDGEQAQPIERAPEDTTTRLSRGKFNLTIAPSTETRPANDDFANAKAIAWPINTTPGQEVIETGNNNFATHELTFEHPAYGTQLEGQPAGFSNSGFRSVWYKLTTSEHNRLGIPLRLTITSSGFESLLQVFARSDTSILGANYTAAESRVEVVLNPSSGTETLYIRVDGRNSTSSTHRSGDFTLKVKRSPLTPLFGYQDRGWETLGTTVDPFTVNPDFGTTWSTTATISGAPFTVAGKTPYSGTPEFLTGQQGAFYGATGGGTPELFSGTALNTPYTNDGWTFYMRRVIDLPSAAVLQAVVTVDDNCIIYVDGVRRGYIGFNDSGVNGVTDPPETSVAVDSAFQKRGINIGSTDTEKTLGLGFFPAGRHVLAVTSQGYNGDDQGFDMRLNASVAKPDVGAIANQAALLGIPLTITVPITNESEAPVGGIILTPVAPTTAVPSWITTAGTTITVNAPAGSIGTYAFTVAAQNANGVGASVPFNLSVAAPAEITLTEQGAGTGLEQCLNNVTFYDPAVGQTEAPWVANLLTPATNVLGPVPSTGGILRLRTVEPAATAAVNNSTLIQHNVTLVAAGPGGPAGDLWAVAPATASTRALQKYGGEDFRIVVGPIAKGSFSRVKGSVDFRAGATSATYFEDADDYVHAYIQSAASKDGPWTTLPQNADIIPRTIGTAINGLMTDGFEADNTTRRTGTWKRHESPVAALIPPTHTHIRLVVDCNNDSTSEFFCFDNLYMLGAQNLVVPPELAEIPATSVRAGEPLSLQTVIINPTQATEYSATGLPAGISINSNGLISGFTNVAPGTFNVTVRAANAAGDGPARSFVLTVGRAFALTAAGVGTGFELATALTNAYVPAVDADGEVPWKTGVYGGTALAPDFGAFTDAALTVDRTRVVAKLQEGGSTSGSPVRAYIVAPFYVSNANNDPLASSDAAPSDPALGTANPSLQCLQANNSAGATGVIVGPVAIPFTGAIRNFGAIQASVDVRTLSSTTSFFEVGDVLFAGVQSATTPAGPWQDIGSIMPRIEGNGSLGATDPVALVGLDSVLNGDWKKYTSAELVFPAGHAFVRVVIQVANNSDSEYMLVDNVVLKGTPGPVDTDGDGMWDSYEIANGLNKDSAADKFLDKDNDGQSNFAEFSAGTGANDDTSFLRITSIVRGTGTDVTVSFPTATGRSYKLQTSTNLATAGWTTFAGTGDTVTGDGTTKTFIVTVPTTVSTIFARVIIP